MSAFKIEEVLSQREFTSQHGPLISYKVRFSGEQGNGEAEVVQRPTTRAPQAGETIDATIEQTQYGPKLKKVPKQPGSGGGYKQDDPKTIARITRSHCQKVAVELLGIEAQVAIAQNGGPHAEHSQKFFALLREPGGVSKALEARIAFFEKSVQEARA